jgi:FolB domain-containing protein
MDKVFIKDLLVRGVIGVSDRERAQPQDIVINITMLSDIQKGGRSDDIADCVNYRTVAKKVMAYAEKAAKFTVEALATDIAELVLEDERITTVVVRVEKPGAVRFSKSVGVEIERSR